LSAIALSFLIVAVAFVWSRSRVPSVDERLAAIEAARAIPDSENAATVYNDLLRDPNATSLLDYRPEFLDEESLNRTSTKPWLSRDHPQLAAWVKEHQYIIDKLVEAAKFEKCRFPIIIDFEKMGGPRPSSMRQWAFLLRFAANNDIAEGRIDAAITKWRCIVQMGNHLRQQPMLLDQLCTDGVERLAWPNIARFIVEGAPTEMHFQKIEAMPLPTANELERNLKDICSVKDMPTQRLTENFGPLEHLRFRISMWRMGRLLDGPDLDDVRRMYLRHTATARGVRMLIALRRYRNESGEWPGNLDEIRSEVPAEILVDPFNKGDFVYKLTDDGVTLYSKGRNNIDEDGQCLIDSRKGPDDWPIWPPRNRSARENAADGE
jgi:hypothetical protein